MIYLPVSSRYSPRATVFIRTAGPSGEVAEVVRKAVLDLDPRLPIKGLEPVLEIRRRLLAPWRLSYLAMGFLGAVAVVLSGAGLYGVLAYTVARRTREIGIRMALGASAPGVVRMVLFGALKLLAAGLGVGFLLSAAVTTLLRGALFGVSPLDPWVYGQVAALLLVVTVVAALLPAVRAASVAPVQAMVEE